MQRLHQMLHLLTCKALQWEAVLAVLSCDCPMKGAQHAC